MKRWMLGLLLALCVCMSTACAEAPVETVLAVIQEEFSEIYFSNVKIEFDGQTESGDVVRAFLMTDTANEQNKLLRPWIFGWQDTNTEVHASDALMSKLGALNALVGQVGSAVSQTEDGPVPADVFTVFNEPEILPYEDRGVRMQVNGYISDSEEMLDMMYVQVMDMQSVPLRDEMFVYCRFGVTLETGEPYVVSMLLTDQEGVARIASTMQEHLPENVTAWYQQYAAAGN